MLSELWDELGTLADRAVDRHLRVAVTGLRRSGKTVFITSLVHHLLDGNGLPFLTAVHENRFLGSRLVGQDRADAFPYGPFHAELSADPPRWPRATDRLANLELVLAYRTRSLVLSRLSPIQHLTVEIIDYPGEWLLDLPLLRLDFAEFSRQAMALARQPLRAPVAAPWLERLAAADPAARADAAVLAELADRYTTYLRRCHGELGLSVVQPGRFTTPDTMAGSPLLQFCPMPEGSWPAGSLGALAAERYRGYRDEIVAGFYRQHFSRFDRQIVLVDLFACLNAGPAHFADTELALSMILESFRYGDASWFQRLFAPRIDKVLFAASKADHVAHTQHANLKSLLEQMIQAAARRPRFSGIAVDVLALAALRSTDTVRTEHEGQVLSCVRGRLKDEGRETVLFPGEIPPDLPEPEDWATGRFRFRDFAPRRLRAGHANQHIRLDQAIEFLIGDKLR
ncbi:MAG: YcjX family protein [Geminicoccaceae bacterium]